MLSLLEAVGTVERSATTANTSSTSATRTKVLTRPRHKDIDVQLVVDLRRMLTGAGYGDTSAE